MQLNAVRYEDFFSSSRGGRGYNNALTLEEEMEMALARARGAAHEAGFEAGRKSAEDELTQTRAAQLASIESALSEAQAMVEGIERSSAQAVLELTRSFIQAVTPHIASSALAPEICATLEEALTEETGAKFIIEVAAESRDEVEEAVASFIEHGAVKANPDLGPTEARVYWEGGFDHISPEATISRALKILDARLTNTLSEQARRPNSDHEVRE